MCGNDDCDRKQGEVDDGKAVASALIAQLTCGRENPCAIYIYCFLTWTSRQINVHILGPKENKGPTSIRAGTKLSKTTPMVPITAETSIVQR